MDEKEVTHRGFRIFGRVSERGGGTLRVQESSIAGEGAHVWIFLDDVECKEHCGEHLKPDPQMSVDQVEELIGALQRFVDEAKRGYLTEPAKCRDGRRTSPEETGMRESCLVLDRNGEPLYWHAPKERTTCAIPDSRSLWDAIWENRERVGGIAHTHPGSGVPGPSYEDVTTFSAIERALGKRLNWWIVSSDKHIMVHYVKTSIPGRYDYAASELPWIEEPSWVAELRRLSGF